MRFFFGSRASRNLGQFRAPGARTVLEEVQEVRTFGDGPGRVDVLVDMLFRVVAERSGCLFRHPGGFQCRLRFLRSWGGAPGEQTGWEGDCDGVTRSQFAD